MKPLGETVGQCPSDVHRFLRCFDASGRQTVQGETREVPTYVNEFWTARQRQANSLHEIAYRACFKPQLPRFFIELLTGPGDVVYDPFLGRGTTLIESALEGRVPFGCDVNPLSEVLTRPRLNPPRLLQVVQRLHDIDLSTCEQYPAELEVFYHPETLRAICALREYLLARERRGELDDLDRWIRMVAVNRLTGHSKGFFSVYTLPPNQAVSIQSQRKINERLGQTPPRRDVREIILRKSRALLHDVGEAVRRRLAAVAPYALLLTRQAHHTPEIPDRSVSLVVTSPPFPDVVDYAGDNWLRCWFCGIDPHRVPITMARQVDEWREAMRGVFVELTRVLKPGGWIAFEVGEVRGGRVRLEEVVLEAVCGLPLEPEAVLIHGQHFTKTAHIWGVSNRHKGTNTHRIVLLRGRDPQEKHWTRPCRGRRGRVGDESEGGTHQRLLGRCFRMRTRYAVMLLVWCLWSVAQAQSTRVLTGRVLDAQGKPIAGAQVYYYPNLVMTWVGVPSDRLPSATTDEQGRYRLTELTISPNSLVAGVVAFHPQHGCNTVRFGQPLARELRLQPLQEFQGKVVNAEGQPVAGATIRLAFISLGGDEVIVPPLVPPFVRQTDAEGTFRLPTSPQMQSLMLVVTALGYEPLLFANTVTWERVSKEGLTLTLKAGARVTAQLVHAGSGEPVRDFPVMAAPYPTYTTTGADGRVTLEVGTGKVTLMPGVSLSSPSMAPSGTFAPLQVENVQPGTTVDLGVIRVYTEPVVTIEVRDENGCPVPFCAVDVRSTDGPHEGAFVLPYFTDTRGQLRLPLAEGRYQITASGPAPGDRYYTSREAREVVVQEGQVREAQPVVVQVTATRIGRPRQAKIQVRTAAGQPPKKLWVQMGGISVEGLEESDTRWRPYRLDGDTLTLELSGLEGRIDRVFVVDTVLWEGAVLRQVSASNSPKQVRLQPLPRVYGRVLDGSGQPVMGARVSLVFGSEGAFPDGLGRVWGETVVPVAISTDKTGRFSLPLLPEGKCWAVVTHRGFEPGLATLQRGQTATVRLRRASAEYAGVLVDAYGEPVAKERIFVRYTFPNSQTAQNRQRHLLPTREVPIGQVVTDEAGRFAMKGMPSSLVLALRGENLLETRLRVQPSRDLVLVRTAQRPPWERTQQPVVPDVEKLLRAVEWLQPVGWQGKQTVLVFTAPYLSGNEQTLKALQQQLRNGWQVAVVLDTADRAEAEAYRRALGMGVPVGYWKRSPSRPKAPSLALLVPGLPYVVHLDEQGKPLRLGVKAEELTQLTAQQD